MRNPVLLAGGCILLAACNLPAGAPQTPVDAASAPPTAQVAFVSAAPVLDATGTATPSPTPTPSPTSSWVRQGPGEVIVPILLYHHIGVSPNNSRYYVTPEMFEQQLRVLHEWGYESISTARLAAAIMEGAELPPRPIVLTFDDGNLDTYFNAYPIMQQYGFTGTLYVVGNYIGVDPFMSADQIKEMAAGGWEIGSHSMRHLELTSLDTNQQRYEIVKSRKILEEKLGVPVLSFSYPFGVWSAGSADFARFAGYAAAVTTDSYGFAQNKYNVYGLQRLEIKSTDDMDRFVQVLPWQGDPIHLTVGSSAAATATPVLAPRPTLTSSP